MSLENKFLIKLDESNYNGQVSISDQGVDQVATKLYNDILEGHTTAVTVAEMFKFVEEVGKSVKGKSDDNGQNTFVDLVRDEIKASSDNGKSFTSRYGTKLELAETGTKYDFSICGDPLWDYYTTQMEFLKELIKKRETFLKTITVPYSVGNLLIPETGELHESVELNPPIKTSTSSYKQTLLKS